MLFRKKMFCVYLNFQLFFFFGKIKNLFTHSVGIFFVFLIISLRDSIGIMRNKIPMRKILNIVLLRMLIMGYRMTQYVTIIVVYNMHLPNGLFFFFF